MGDLNRCAGQLPARGASLAAHRQRGMALLLAMMVIVIVAILATEVLYRQDRFLARTQNLTDWDRRYQYAIAAETLAIQALIDDLEDDQRNSALHDDCITEGWAVAIPPTPYEDATVSATIQDLQGRFNLNWLVTRQATEYQRDELWRARLAELLRFSLSDDSRAERLSHEMADWLDSNNIVDGPEGAEDSDYRWRRVPNQPVFHESELRALYSMRAEDLPGERFWSLYVALPVGTRLNVNTAPWPVLDAVFADTVGHEGTRAVLEARAEDAITDLATLAALAPFAALDEEVRTALFEQLDVRSSYFQINVDIVHNGQRTRLVSRLQRLEGGRTAVFARQTVPVLAPLPPRCNDYYTLDESQGISNDNAD